MEFWNGWFDHWGTEHHTRPGDDAAAELAAMLAAGRSVNLYMAHGGTNFGTWAGANLGADGDLEPTVTSYDYDAPLAEDGRATPKFHAFRNVISAHTGVQPPELPADPAVQPERTEMITAVAELHAFLDTIAAVPSPTPERFERLGLHHGVVRYRTRLQGPYEGALRLDGLADLAELRLDGVLIGRLGRLAADPAYAHAGRSTVPVQVPDGVHDLDVTVHSLGRVNYGPALGDPKGVTRVLLDHQQQFGYEQWPLDLTEMPDLSGAHWRESSGAGEPRDRPGFHRVSVEVDDPADAYLELPQWQTGYLFLNGFNLGRYWNPAGPQRTLYAPAPLWRPGANELVVVEFGRPGREIRWRSEPLLG
jgi:beta-galactosidase